MLRFVHHADARSFRAHANALLHAREAECSLLLGIASSSHAEKADAVLVTVDDGGTAVAAAIRTPPHRLIITSGSDDVLRCLARGASSIDPALPGVVGPASAAKIVAETIAPDRARPLRNMRVHELIAVADVPRPAGEFRPARADEIDLLVSWGAGFVRDTGIDDAPPSPEAIGARIRDATLFVWDDGGPRTMAAWGRPTTSTATINMVFTPEDQRGRGYATACVAALSQHLLDTGRRSCVLFTNVHNPTSNAIYARIGYRKVADFDEWVWSPPA